MNKTEYTASAEPKGKVLRPSGKVRRQYTRVSRDLQATLARFALGRIALHLVLAFKTSRYAWHFQGIVRELTRITPPQCLGRT